VAVILILLPVTDEMPEIVRVPMTLLVQVRTQFWR